MKTRLLHDAWMVELPADLVREAGLSAGEDLECQVFPGGFALTAPDVPIPGTMGVVPPAKKKYREKSQSFFALALFGSSWAESLWQ